MSLQIAATDAPMVFTERTMLIVDIESTYDTGRSPLSAYSSVAIRYFTPDEVNPRRARLVLGWVTVFGWVYRLTLYVTSQLGQLSLASLRGRLIEYQLQLGQGRECHLCRVAGNTV